MSFSKSKRLEVKILKRKRITAVLVDTAKEVFGIVNVPDELETFYALLGCSCIDITVRKIGTKTVEISAINNLGRAQLVGSILIVGPADSEGNLTSLSSKDANYILDRIQLLETRNFKNPYPILTQCEYA